MYLNRGWGVPCKDKLTIPIASLKRKKSYNNFINVSNINGQWQQMKLSRKQNIKCLVS